MKYGIVMIGPPCSGKGTHSEKIVEKLGFVHISSGNMFRSEIAKKSSLGILAKTFVDRGEYVPDELTLDLVFNRLNSLENNQGFVLDGVPRTLLQAESFEKYFEENNIKCDLVFYLNSPYEILLQRMNKRSVEGRADDDERVFEKRIASYVDNNKILIEYYSSKGRLIDVSTNAPIEKVSLEIFDYISKHLYV